MVQFHLTVDGRELEDAHIVGFQVSHDLGVPASLLMELFAGDPRDLDAKRLLGKSISLVAEDDDGSELLFDGLVAATHVSHERGGFRRTEIQAHGWTLPLKETGSPRSFESSSIKEIVESIFSEHDISVEFRAEDAQLKWTVHQFGESDFDFIRRLLDENEYVVDASRLPVRIIEEFEGEPTELSFGVDGALLSFGLRARIEGLEVEGHYHDPSRDVVHDARAEKSVSKRHDLVDVAAEASRRTARGQRRLDGVGRVRSPGDFERRLQRESRRRHRQLVTGFGTTHSFRLRLGGLLEIAEGDSEDGTYGIVSLQHVWDGDTYLCHFSVSAADRFDLPVPDVGSREVGLVTARVVDNEDPSGQGRVKVRHSWQADGETSYWARLASPHAGPERGLYFVPEVDDEVLVGFINGDIERPVIVGSTWNGAYARPSHAVESNDVKVIRTRSGAEILIADESGKERLELRTPNDECILRLTNDGSPTIHVQSEQDVCIEAVKGDVGITASRGDVQVEASEGNVEVKAESGNIAMEAPRGELRLSAREVSVTAENIAIDGSQSVKTSGQQLELSGASMVKVGGMQTEISATSMMAIKGMPVKLN